MIAWLMARLGAPFLAALTLAFASGFLWQTARIEGWPLIGGGLRQQIALLQRDTAAGELARAKAEAASLAAQARRAEAANAAARVHEEAKRTNADHRRKVTESVHVRVGEAGDRLCVLPWGAVRLLDAAASGADPDLVAALVAPGRPDDAASDVSLSETVALLADNLARARINADQLRQLQRAAQQDPDGPPPAP